MDDVPPPTEHILRPHHVGLLTILIFTFKELDSKTIPSSFTLHLFRELLNEISEACLIIHQTPTQLLMAFQVSPPKSRQELLHALSQGSEADTDGARYLLASFQAVVSELVNYIISNNPLHHIVRRFEKRGTNDDLFRESVLYLVP